MSLIVRAACVVIGAMALQGCIESTLDKQVKACVQDVKLGLGDPSSMEVLNTEEIEVRGGGHRIKLQYTAKNAMGGRVRGEDICGFKDKGSTELDSDDFMNKNRYIARSLRELGIRVK